MNQQPNTDPLVLSYLGLRRAVGIIGCYLPFVLIFGKLLLQSRGLEDSISSYYYTTMGDVFVGSMCAIDIFLMSCRGYDRRDTIAGLGSPNATPFASHGLLKVSDVSVPSRDATLTRQEMTFMKSRKQMGYKIEEIAT